MGQKINPTAFRLGVNRGWDSIWFAKKKEFVVSEFLLNSKIDVLPLVRITFKDIVLSRVWEELFKIIILL